MENLSQLDQQTRRQGSAVALDQVEVAGRDTQALRQLDLIEALLAAQGSNFGAQPQTLWSRSFRHTSSWIDTTLQHYTV